MGRYRTVKQIAGNDPASSTVFDDHIEQFSPGVQLHAAGRDLAQQGRIGPEEELLTGLPAGIESPRNLSSTEGTVVEKAAVLTSEGHALSGGLIDDVRRHLGQTVHICLTGPVVAALDGVVEEPMD